jgi:hypothetical protein
VRPVLRGGAGSVAAMDDGRGGIEGYSRASSGSGCDGSNGRAVRKDVLCGGRRTRVIQAVGVVGGHSSLSFLHSFPCVVVGEGGGGCAIACLVEVVAVIPCVRRRERNRA